MAAVNEIEEALALIRPRLQADGGDVEFVSLSEDGIVSVRLKGACGSCPMALMTLKMGIEAQLKEAYPEIKEVVSVR
ncbi:MAG: NifU family protein [Treponema sp.]